MFLSNSRIEKNEKIIFYEQDILLDDHIYTGNVHITMTVDYITPGIGIALVSSEGLSLSDDGETYLFRVGHSDYSVTHRVGDKIDTLESGPVINIRPFKKDFKIEIKKINNRVSFYVDEKLLYRKYMPTDLHKYMIGCYSSAGNIINSINVESEIPNGWVINMNNTQGGYINFERNKFILQGCSDKGEVEQVRIPLKANTFSNPKYYLKFEKEDVDGANDIVAYVFNSDDTRIHDKEKNILHSDNSFVIQHDRDVTLKFVGTVGAINSVMITDSYDDFYVGTDYDGLDTKESFIKVKVSEIEKIEFSGILYNIPTTTAADVNQERYGIIKDDKKFYTIDQLRVNMNQYYDYTITVNHGAGNSKLSIKRDNLSDSFDIDISNDVYIFYNVGAKIDKLVLHTTSGKIIDTMIEKTKTQYIPASINGPIVITGETGIPLDLSSSYRIINDNGKTIYEFTNEEREVFDSNNKIKLKNRASKDIGSITVYCIKNNSDIHPENLYISRGKNIKDISDYANSYVVLEEDELYSVDKITGIITLFDNDEHLKYKQFVVDYMKEDSYCINYKHDMGSYEVDISTNQSTKAHYDGIVDENNFANVDRYKLLNSSIRNNSYIVIKGR